MTAPHLPGTPARRRVRRPQPVPTHVFWVRRVVVLGVLGGLVWAAVALVRLLDPSMDGGEPARATTAGASDDAEPADEEAGGSAEGRASRKERRAKRIARRAVDAADPTKEPGKPMPTGPCSDSDVVVTPSVPDGHAGGPVEVVLELSTLKAEACSWQVDPESVFVTITKGSTTLWSSQHCPRAIPAAPVIPRQETPDRVRLDWSGKESQPGCSVASDWVWPGTYSIHAVARGSVNAVEASFALGYAEPATAPQPAEAEGDGDRRDERREARREAREEVRAEEEARGQAEREQARRDALQQAREAQREERREAQREERRERRQERRGDREERQERRQGSGDRDE